MVIIATKLILAAKEHLNVPKSQELLIVLYLPSMEQNAGMIHIIMVIVLNMVVHIYQKIHVEANVNGLAHVWLNNVTH